MWVGETIADIVGYPLAGLFVAVARDRAPARVLARRGDLPRLGGPARDDRRPAGRRPREPSDGRRPRHARRSSGRCGPAGGSSAASRPCSRTPLQASVAQFTVGALLALMSAYARPGLRRASGLDWKAVYGFLETSVGAGNLIGGFVIGLVGARLAEGPADHRGLRRLRALHDPAGALEPARRSRSGSGSAPGVANMVFIIPSQTLFQERTPADADGPGRQLPVRARLRRR